MILLLAVKWKRSNVTSERKLCMGDDGWRVYAAAGWEEAEWNETKSDTKLYSYMPVEPSISILNEWLQI